MEKEMATHSIVLAWRIPGTVEPGGQDWSDAAAAGAGEQSSSWGDENIIKKIVVIVPYVCEHIKKYVF